VTPATTEKQARGYADIGGHRTWFADSHGAGDPVLVLHGGLTDSDLMLESLEPPLGDRFRILAFDRRGHGRTADTEAAFHYDDMASETIAAIETLIGGPTHLLGWSDGANVALLVALRRPDLVRSLVLIGANYHFDGTVAPDFGETGPKVLKDRYAQRSPDGGEHFAAVFQKSRAMWAAEPTLTTDDLRKISAPALVMVGDDDLMTFAHTASLYESLPMGQLAVIPGTSHGVVLEKPELVTRLVGDFLNAPGKPKTQLPLRRRSVRN
jgi:pimeloyl-ACP methyl ester carboxylesterase